ncbi:MAG: L-glutamate gamma-semialdehyde dehydrogenase [Chloroflexota bacterium]
MVTEQNEQKVTYTTMSVGQAQRFHERFDTALAQVMRDVGEEYPVYIADEARTTGREPFQSVSPNDVRCVVGTFQECREPEADAAVAAARNAYRSWGRTPWQERVRVLRRAATNFRDRKYDIAAWLSLEAGKPRLEAMGEVEEAADLLDAYCDYTTEANGFVRTLEQLSPTEHNVSVLKPYGVWLVVAPFNFPVALATGMIAGALVAGNTVVFKPSPDTPLAGLKLYECLRDAGLPAGSVNILTGSGSETGEALSRHPGVDGVAFTGSRAVGTHIYSEVSRERPRPCITEMGGKNPVIVSRHADLAKAVEGTVRAAFGYSGQKCSAASRAYVHDDVFVEFVRRLAVRTQELAVGDATQAETFVGPVINQRAYERFQRVCERARADGTLATGGTVLRHGALEHGYYCAPTIATLPPAHPYFFEELFVPFVAVASVGSFDEALRRATDSEYGLTAGVFTENPDEIRAFQDEIEAGVTYVNRTGGATTGAWPKVQSFGGWKASGSPGKNALGPYYVQQFMREQTQTVVSD